MPRTKRDYRLETRSARLRLPSRRAPYWVTIIEGRAIGYHRGELGSAWFARYRNSVGQRFQKHLGSADDAVDADAEDVLTFAGAQAAARAWFDELDRANGKRVDRYTVASALDDYLASFTGKSLEKTRHTIERHIRPVLGHRVVSELTTADLAAFQATLVRTPAFYRPNRKGVRRERPAGPDPLRTRRASANRIFTPLRAALNRAFNNGRVADDAAWRRIKPFGKVDSARVRYFTAPEINALFDAAEPWFRSLLQAALLTGGRWSELHRMKVRDVDLSAGVVHFPETKGGRPRYVHLSDEGIVFFARAVAGKPLSQEIFLNQHGRPLGPSHQIRPMRETCIKAQVDPAGFHILRHTYGSTLAMAGVPLAVIAETLGHADERITRKHYAHLAPSYVRDTVRAGLGGLGAYRGHSLRVVS